MQKIVGDAIGRNSQDEFVKWETKTNYQVHHGILYGERNAIEAVRYFGRKQHACCGLMEK